MVPPTLPSLIEKEYPTLKPSPNWPVTTTGMSDVEPGLNAGTGFPIATLTYPGQGCIVVVVVDVVVVVVVVVAALAGETNTAMANSNAMTNRYKL
jgi:hypothetical protein